MGEQDLDRGAKLIHAKTRQAEYEAFLAWIKACCADAKLRDLPRLADAELAKPEKPDAVIRHNRKDRLLDSFVRNVWSQRMRCFPCHTPFELDAVSQQHPKARETHRQFEEQFGQRMNFFKETPEATLRQLIVSSRKPAKGHLPRDQRRAAGARACWCSSRWPKFPTRTRAASSRSLRMPSP